MRSGRAKVLHRLGGLPLVTWSVRAVRPLVDRVVVVVGHEREAVQSALAEEDVVFAVQEEQLGTGHALRCAADAIAGSEVVVVLAGDVPRLTTASLQRLLDAHATRRASATLLTFVAADPAGYGRIIRDETGVRSIVEDRQATPEERAIAECNAGLYAFATAEVLPLVSELPARSSSEIYLPDAIERLVAAGRPVAALEVPEDEVAGINTQAQLAQAEARYRASRAEALMGAGVTLIDPAQVAIDADADAGPGTTLHPFVALQGRTRVGSRCEIGPLVRLTDVTVGDGATIRGPVALRSTNVPAGAIVG